MERYTEQDYMMDEIREYSNEYNSVQQDLFVPEFIKLMSDDDLCDFLNHFNLTDEFERSYDEHIKETREDFIIDNYADEFVRYYQDAFDYEFKCYIDCL